MRCTAKSYVDVVDVVDVVDADTMRSPLVDRCRSDVELSCGYMWVGCGALSSPAMWI